MTYGLEDYAAMMADPVRSAAYLAAIRDTVTDGTVFADIGSGPGVLGVYAAVCGARRVYCVEPDASVGAVVELARENGVLDRIEVIRRPSTEISFPELADVIVSDLRGVLPLFGAHLAAAADMRARLLRPGGVCIPRRDVLCTALVEDDALHARTVGAWNLLPHDMRHASLTRLAANQWYRTHATSEQLLTSPEAWITLDYAQPAPALDGGSDGIAIRAGTAHGLLCWFDTELTERIGFSNAPSAPRALYGQAFFPFERPIELWKGDRVTTQLRAVGTGSDHEWTWSARVYREELVIARAEHASLFGSPLQLESLARRTSRFVPALSDEAHALRTLLTAVDGARDLGALAAVVREQHPDRFPTESSALRFVTRHESLWTW